MARSSARPAGRSTIGGVVCAGIAGSSRLTRGAARDHLLGFAAVSGRGEPFVAGAKVVKNVTGYDLPKLATGSWGRLVRDHRGDPQGRAAGAARIPPRCVIRGLSRCRGLCDNGARARVAGGTRRRPPICRPARLRPSPCCGSKASALGRGAHRRCLIALFGADAVLETLDADAADTLWRGFRTLASARRDQAPLAHRRIPARALPTVAEALAASGSSLARRLGGRADLGDVALAEPDAVRRMAAERRRARNARQGRRRISGR